MKLIRDMENYLKGNEDVLSFFRTGSSVVSLNKKAAKDIDYVVLPKEYNYHNLLNRLEMEGFAPDDDFRSFRIGKFNVIVVKSPREFLSFEAATVLATKYSHSGFFEAKENRVSFFEAIRKEKPFLYWKFLDLLGKVGRLGDL